MKKGFLFIAIAVSLTSFSFVTASTPVEAFPQDLALELLKSWIDFEIGDLRTIWYALTAFYHHDCPEGISLLSSIAARKLTGKLIPGKSLFWIDLIANYFGLSVDIDSSIIVERLIERTGLNVVICERFSNIYVKVKGELDWVDVVLHPIESSRVIKNALKEEAIVFKGQFLAIMAQLLVSIMEGASPGSPSTPPLPPSPHINKGLVGYWHFDERTGNVAIDSSGHNYNGVIHGATFVQGISGTALYFDGSAFVDLGRPRELYATSITIAEWVKFTQVSYPASVTVNDYSASDGEWGIIIYFDKEGHPGANVGAGPDNHAMGAHGYIPLNDGRWHFVAAIYDNSDKTITLYVDGRKIAQNNWAGTDGGFRNYDDLTHDKARCGWYIGIYSQYFFNNLNGSRHFIGTIDEVLIYNKPLSPEEIWSLYTLHANTGF